MPFRELIDVNTQVRRLGYFAPLVRYAARQSLNADSLALRLQKWGAEVEVDLKNYQNTTGNVVPHIKKSRRRNIKLPKLKFPVNRASHAARKYVDFAENIGWLSHISGMYAVSRTGRVLLAITDELNRQDNSTEKVENAFQISEGQSFFFISELWRNDGDVIFTLLKMLKTNALPLKEIQQNYYSALREQLQNRLQETTNEKDAVFLLNRINNIAKWQNPARYAEQFVPTRLNWLLDLGLVMIDNSTKRSCSLTKSGERFQNSLDTPNVLTDEWINSSFFKVTAKHFVRNREILTYWCESSEQVKYFTISLQNAFDKFKRSLVPKFSVTQICLYVCLEMITKNRIVMDYLDFINFLSKPLNFSEGSIVEIRLSARENEAYLIINPV